MAVASTAAQTAMEKILQGAATATATAAQALVIAQQYNQLLIQWQQAGTAEPPQAVLDQLTAMDAAADAQFDADIQKAKSEGR